MSFDPKDFSDGHEIRDFGRRLSETAELAERCEWPDDLFRIDPDHYMVTLAVVCAKIDEQLNHQTMMDRCLLAAFDHFVDLDARCRILDAIDRNLDIAKDTDTPSQLRLVKRLVADPQAPAYGVPFLASILIAKVREAARKRFELRDAEPTEHPEIDSILQDTAQLLQTDTEGIARIAERLASFGQTALPFVEKALDESVPKGGLRPDSGGQVAALAQALGRIGGDRAIEGLVRLLTLDEHEDLKKETLQSFLLAGERAALIVTDMLHLGLFQYDRRLHAFDVLLALGRDDFAEFVMADFDESNWPEGRLTDAVFARLVDIAVQLRDRQVVPFFVRLIRRKSLAPERRNLLRNRLAKTEWGEEVQTALSKLKEGLPVFVKADEAGEVGKAKRKQKRGKKREFSPEEIARALREAYHEDLGWRRPADVEAVQRQEEATTEKVREIAERDFRAYCLAAGIRTPDEQTSESFRDVWLLEPHKALDGESPWAFMAKQRASALSPRLAAQFIDREAASLYHCALDVVESGETKRGKLRLAAVLSIKPDHALARRLLSKLDEGESRIAVPGE